MTEFHVSRLKYHNTNKPGEMLTVRHCLTSLSTLYYSCFYYSGLLCQRLHCLLHLTWLIWLHCVTIFIAIGLEPRGMCYVAWQSPPALLTSINPCKSANSVINMIILCSTLNGALALWVRYKLIQDIISRRRTDSLRIGMITVLSPSYPWFLWVFLFIIFCTPFWWVSTKSSGL